MPIPLRYSLGPFGLDPSLADPDAAVAIAPKPESVVEDESYSKSQNNPLVFDPAQRRYIRAYDPQAEAIGFVPPATPRTQTTPMAPPARSFAPTPEQLDQQRDRWFAQVSPMAAMGNRRAQAAIEAADRAMIREKVSQGMTYAQALMETRMHSGLPITLAEESLARQVAPAKQWTFTPGTGETPGAFMAPGERPYVPPTKKPSAEEAASAAATRVKAVRKAETESGLTPAQRISAYHAELTSLEALDMSATPEEKKAHNQRRAKIADELSKLNEGTTTTPQTAQPKVGEVRKGYRFKGGNPADAKSWEKVS